jgi:hypothetical protein
LIKGDLVLPVLSDNGVSQEVDLSLASLGPSVRLECGFVNRRAVLFLLSFAAHSYESVFRLLRGYEQFQFCAALLWSLFEAHQKFAKLRQGTATHWRAAL